VLGVDPSTKNLLLLIPAVIVAAPALIMAHSFIEVRRWSRVPGVVLSTELVRMRYPKSRARSFRPVVRYGYTVDGKEYRSSILAHGMQSGGSKRWAQRIVDLYPVGATITVLHHPTQPERACLTAQFGFFGWVLVVLSSLLLLLAVIV
jgi:hypothetical protein